MVHRAGSYCPVAPTSACDESSATDVVIVGAVDLGADPAFPSTPDSGTSPPAFADPAALAYSAVGAVRFVEIGAGAGFARVLTRGLRLEDANLLQHPVEGDAASFAHVTVLSDG